MVDVAALPVLREAGQEGWSRCVVLVGSGAGKAGSGRAVGGRRLPDAGTAGRVRMISGRVCALFGESCESESARGVSPACLRGR